jgi:alpha-glucosidase (family GH31 glycosyl hydrolase)
MTDNDVRDQIEEFREYSLPLDVLILDMNWHKKNDWTGYTFDSNLFPSKVR